MNTRLAPFTTAFALFLAASALAQTSPEQSATAPPPGRTSDSAMGQMQGGMLPQAMDKMADSVTKMSEMCQMMMQKEMTGAPYKMAAGLGLGALLLIALVLFVILEIQWIIYWGRLLKRGKTEERT